MFLLLWSWWCKSCDGVSGCNILTHQPPPGCAISLSLCTIAAPAYHPPPSLPPLPFPLTEPLSRSLVIFLTLASCLATVSHAIDTNYTRPDPCNGALFTGPGVMYQYPANCCQAPHTGLCWHSVMCQVSADTNQNKWQHPMSSPFQIQFSVEVDDIWGMESGHFLHQQVESQADHLRWTEGWWHNGEYSGMRRGEMRGEKSWQWLWCDTDGCWEGGMIRHWRRLVTPRWWADDISSWEELSTVTRCHIVNIIESQKINWQILVATSSLCIKVDHYLKQRIFGKMSWWCWVTSVFCGYQKTIIELIFPLSSVFCWLSNVTLWCTDNGLDGELLILRRGEKLGESLLQDDDIWWVEMEATWADARQQFPDYYLQRRKMGNVITMGESELWVNIVMASFSLEIDGHRKNLI